ncbi:MAG: tRNA 2-selenouridine(34) synthase MnmH [Bacteroidales bacterium]|nr:tRNA 2-selenouridine(34) synthase MnmH [Bacteroidales bacterium]
MNTYPVRTGVKEFIELSGAIKIIDVRTPSEYERGHIPRSFNIPLFSDDERARVGTVYKQQNQISAIMEGLDIVGPKMSCLLKKGMQESGKEKKLLLYCWRGGSRSESMAWLFSNAGIDCTVLEGGYKAYRNHILSELGISRKLIVLGGLTGSGKTAILSELSILGEQVIDMEKLACHKGSAFGALGQDKQPSSEHFANLLHDELRKYNSDQRLFVEDESHNIGTVSITENFFSLMKEAPVIALMPDIKTRLPRLRTEYGVFGHDQLIESVQKISRKLGGDNTKKAVNAIMENDLDTAIEIVLKYYDKTYGYGLSQKPKEKVVYVESPSDDPQENAAKVKMLADKIEATTTAV